jgi:predicted ATPase
MLRSTAANRNGAATHWSIVTGPPYSGKTSLVNALSVKGRMTVEDAGRAEIEAQIREGSNKWEARENYLTLQERICIRMHRLAAALKPDQCCIWDYSFPDNLAFLALRGHSWSSTHIESATKYRFQNIFICRPLPGPFNEKNDPLRVEDEQERAEIFELLCAIYTALGYSPVILPAKDMASRLKVIEENLPAGCN